MPALGIPARPQCNCSKSPINQAVAREFLLMDLVVRAKEKRIFFKV